MYDPKESRAWKEEIKRQIKAQWSGELFSGPLHLYLHFYLTRPKSNKSKEHVVRPDVDNLVKAILDAAQGITFKNDSQFVFIAAGKGYCNEKHQEPCIVGTIQEA